MAESIIDIGMVVQYRIIDPTNYLFNLRRLHDTVKSSAEAARSDRPAAYR